MIKNNTLDLEQIKVLAKQARERLSKLSPFELAAIEVISKAAASEESIEFLYSKENNRIKSTMLAWNSCFKKPIKLYSCCSRFA
jgi:hypothetical protein